MVVSYSSIICQLSKLNIERRHLTSYRYTHTHANNPTELATVSIVLVLTLRMYIFQIKLAPMDREHDTISGDTSKIYKRHQEPPLVGVKLLDAAC